MPVVLKNAVVDQLRAARAVDDTLSRLRENSWEVQRTSIVRLVESNEWRHGPAELIATFDHHALAKAPNGDVVQVEWHRDDDGATSLGRAVVHESATPVSDLGYEVMETARTAVDKILDEDYESAAPMIAGITEALDAGGDLQRQIGNEVLVQSLTRCAWWHDVVGIQEDANTQLPDVTIEDIQVSTTDLLVFLKEQASELSVIARQFDVAGASQEVETLVTDVAEDVQRAISALMNLDRRRTAEVTKIYEAVMTASPQLVSGIAFLKNVSEQSDKTSN